MLVENQTSFSNVTNINALSVFFLVSLKPAFVLWVIVDIVNISAAGMLLVILPKWKIFEGDIWFLMKVHLVAEIVLNASLLVTSIWHLINAYLGWPETMLQVHFVKFQMLSNRCICFYR